MQVIGFLMYLKVNVYYEHTIFKKRVHMLQGYLMLNDIRL